MRPHGSAGSGAAAPSHTAQTWVALLERGPLCGAGSALLRWSCGPALGGGFVSHTSLVAVRLGCPAGFFSSRFPPETDDFSSQMGPVWSSADLRDEWGLGGLGLGASGPRQARPGRTGTHGRVEPMDGWCWLTAGPRWEIAVVAFSWEPVELGSSSGASNRQLQGGCAGSHPGRRAPVLWKSCFFPPVCFNPLSKRFHPPLVRSQH